MWKYPSYTWAHWKSTFNAFLPVRDYEPALPSWDGKVPSEEANLDTSQIEVCTCRDNCMGSRGSRIRVSVWGCRRNMDSGVCSAGLSHELTSEICVHFSEWLSNSELPRVWNRDHDTVHMVTVRLSGIVSRYLEHDWGGPCECYLRMNLDCLHSHQA